MTDSVAINIKRRDTNAVYAASGEAAMAVVLHDDGSGTVMNSQDEMTLLESSQFIGCMLLEITEHAAAFTDVDEGYPDAVIEAMALAAQKIAEDKRERENEGMG